MQLCSGAVIVHRRDDVCKDGETVQSMAVNPSGTILAVVTQLHLHFWTAGPKIVYLTSLLIPDTTLDDNAALFVIWRPRQGNHLAVVTARQVVFFEADINVKPGEFLQSVERQRSGVVLQHTDSASRVCYSCEIRIEAGLAMSAVSAGPYAFLVTTTAGVVYVVGWHQQDVLHQWTTVGLQDNGQHSFTSSVALEGEATGTVSPGTFGAATAAAAAAAALKLANASVESASMACFTGPRGSITTPLSATVRVDPLQRRYQPQPTIQPQQNLRPPSLSSHADPSSITNPASATTGAAPPLAAGGICPPGAAVHSGDDYPSSASQSASQTLAAAASEAAPHQITGSALQNSGGVDNVTATDPVVATGTPLTGAKSYKTGSLLASASSGVTDTDGSGAGGGVASAGAGLGQRRTNGGELLSGTILHASFVSRWKVLSFVFSSGAVLLCRPSCGTNFTHTKVQLQGCVTPLVSASMVAINMRHLLLAVCTQAGALSCRHIDGSSLAVSATPLWKGLRGLQDRFAGHAGSPGSASAQSLGLISALEWSPSEELLCVAFYKCGMVLVHYSGAVVTHHLSGPACATLLRSPGASGVSAQQVDTDPSSSRNDIGCSFASWKADGTRLWMAAPDQACFFSTQLSRVLMTDTVGPTAGSHTPLALLADNALYLISVSEATERQGVRDLVLVPEEYLRDQFPLLYGAVSCDGNWIACAGRRGLLIFNRDRFSWKLASQKQEEMAFSCVADPVWLRNVAVAVPALRTDTKAYELIVLPTSSVSSSHALTRVALEGKPAMLSCVHQDHRSEGYVVLTDFNQVVRVFRYDVFVDAPGLVAVGGAAASASPAKAYVALTPVQQLALTGDLASPLLVLPVCLRRAEDDRENPQRTKDQTELRLLLHCRSNHALVWIRGVAAATASDTTAPATPKPITASSSSGMPHLNAVSEPFDGANQPPAFVYHCWVDRTPPVRGAVLLTHDEEAGVVLHHLQPQRQPQVEHGVVGGVGGGGSAGLAVQRMEVMPTRDTELLPLCASPFDGYLLCCGTDTSVPRQTRRGTLADNVNTPAHPQLVLRPVLYAHRILSLLLLAAMPGGGTPLRAPHADSPQLPSLTASPLTTDTFSRNASDYAPLATPQVSAAEIDGRVASFVWDTSLFLWLEQMRLNDTFVAAMDYFLHTALNESPPAAVPGLGRRSAIRAVITLLRNYPEFYTIVVGCVRKIDFTRWHLVLDFLGTATALFRECVAHHCYAEAVHLVRVIMMGSYKPTATLSVERLRELSNSGGDALASRSHSNKDVVGSRGGSLEQASQCAVELFGLSIENGDYTAAYDLLRFVALLEDEIGMPAAGSADLDGGGGDGADVVAGGGGGGSESFLTRWLRQLTFSGVAYDDPEAAVDETLADGTAELTTTTTTRTGSAAGAQRTKNQLGNYPTLVLDVARCVPGHGGRSPQDTAEEVQRQSAVRHMFGRYKTLPAMVHEEALRLLLTGYVTQLAKLMETFSLSVPHFIRTACKLITLSTAGPAGGDSLKNSAAGNAESDYTLHLHEVFDGLHKELGLPRSFYVPNTAAASTSWNGWIVDQQTARAASLPGVLSATNPKVWTVAQSVLYATPELRTSVESLHRLFRGVFVYNLAFCVLLMRKSDLISLLLSADGAIAAAQPPSTDTQCGDASPDALITVLDHLEALLAVPENSGYKPFLHDVFQSLPPSALRAHLPTRAIVAANDASPSAVLGETK
jgi:RAB6A-GEF complex partner protein 1